VTLFFLRKAFWYRPLCFPFLFIYCFNFLERPLLSVFFYISSRRIDLFNIRNRSV